ncbi:Uncharacterised protein [Shigella sonnei]|nr:Uncharacterised protein [Shigella sonnei]
MILKLKHKVYNSIQTNRINIFVITKLSESLIFTLSYKINKMQPNSKPHIFSIKYWHISFSLITMHIPANFIHNLFKVI